MDWQDEGSVLSMRRHGETSAILEVLTRDHGRHAGVVRGGASRRQAAHLQPGTRLALSWRARLDDHLGVFTVEPARARAGILSDPGALMALNSVCALVRFALPERDPHPVLFAVTETLLDLLAAGDAGWPRAYLCWERDFLQEMGFGLDLSACAVTGTAEGLVHVSPRTGRAVSAAGAGVWADRLLPLPPCLRAEEAAAPPADILAGLATTGHFLERHLAPELVGKPLPAARARLVAGLSARVAGGGAK
ncbi:DNA repair protein RecO [Phaeovulum vinaykumarii]|uniref:DNA repair protein RecO n=1 Tax=Phaeovulum vinaykumarii TaxID=407234 RepID=A0A1N7KDJ2_9RHOB|nr:DNA repair protein RecO [Phaeovulum vinaykumarii]SIS59619.1 DNA replication and repair protein RecO [Phaeovulum vinaykumarii]SOB94169.1 DNA replication and repair protein RecO [Phaeovulum vinaykumarii]